MSAATSSALLFSGTLCFAVTGCSVDDAAQHVTDSALAGAVQIVAATGQTGFDITNASASSGYMLYAGNPSVWANLQTGGFVEFAMNVQSAGTYEVQLYYSTALAGQAAAVSIDGSAPVSAPLASTGNWGQFALGDPAPVQLPAGNGTLRISGVGNDPAFNLEGLLVTRDVAVLPPPSTPPSTPPTTSGSYPLASASFYVSPYSSAGSYAMASPGDACLALYPSQPNLLAKIVSQPQGVWFGSWNADPRTDAANVMAAAGSAIPIVVVYDIPLRDCGGYSAGGTDSIAGYESWIDQLTQGIDSHAAAVVLEPDALSQLGVCLSASEQQDRLAMLRYAVSSFAAHAPNASVYLDAGHEGAVDVPTMAARLTQAGIADAAGFALDTSNYLPTDLNTAYGSAISALVGGKHFVIDTSRNGSGGDLNQWCNVPNQSLGEPPQGFSSGLVDAYLWVQNPGESDGDCDGDPNAGTFWLAQACGLAARASW